MSTSTSTHNLPTRPHLPSSSLTPITGQTALTTNSPRTPLLSRSISSQFGTPTRSLSDHEDQIIYELTSRYLSAGFAGESRPRCMIYFTLEDARRVGDYRAWESGYVRKKRGWREGGEEDWGRQWELFRLDLRKCDLGLVEDRLERALRTVHVEYLQLDAKPRKAVLVVPSLFPTPLLEVALKVLFNYNTQQAPAVTILTMPLLACVGAGVRNALVVDIGWEETVVTAVGEYREVCSRRSVRAGKRLTWEMGKMLDEEVRNQRESTSESAVAGEVDFEYAEEVVQRMAWCRTRPSSETLPEEQNTMTKLPSPTNSASPSQTSIHVPFIRLSYSTETTFFAASSAMETDDHDLALPLLAYRVLLALSPDLRALCISRIVITGTTSDLPGLRPRLLQELAHLLESRGWDPVDNYGSAGKPPATRRGFLSERSVNVSTAAQTQQREQPLSPIKPAKQDSLPASQRIHDDKNDLLSQKAEREASRGKGEDSTKGVVRGVETLGAWAGASLMASLRVKGAYEFERDEFLKNGLVDSAAVV